MCLALHVCTENCIWIRLNNIYNLDQCHIFTPVAIETAGPFGPETFMFLRQLGCRLKQVTGEPKSISYLQQHLSIAMQRGNAAAVMGSMRSTTSPFDFFHNLVFFLEGTCLSYIIIINYLINCINCINCI